MRTIGQEPSLDDYGKQPPDRLLRPETCRIANSHNWAAAAIGAMRLERRLCSPLPPFDRVRGENHGRRVRMTAY